MKSCVHINEAEAIFEAFWDSGDTYANHEKFDRMKNYTLSGDGGYSIGWKGVQVYTNGHFTMSRRMELGIKGFDTLCLNMNLPKGMHVTVRAEIDGVLQEIMVCTDAEISEFEGHISGEKLTYIELEFIKVGDTKTFCVVFSSNCRSNTILE